MLPPRRLAVWLENPAPHLTITDRQAARLAAEHPGADVALARTEDAFRAALAAGADTALAWRFRQEWFDHAPALRWIATPAAGKDYFRIAPPAGVRVTYGAFHGPLMAETVVGMMLAACRGILAAATAMSPASPWPRGLARASRTLAGSRVAIVGFGAIGQWIGRLAKPFGVRLTGVNRRTRTRPDYFTAADRTVALADLDAVLPQTDHLVLCAPAGPDSDGLVDARRLALLPPGAGVYNVGRGNIVDEAALAAGLCAGRPAHACLDVFAHEPLPAGSPLWGAPGFYPMPHISALAPDYLDRFLDEFAARANAPSAPVPGASGEAE